MSTLLQDLRYGVRMLARTPGFAFISILTLALGIGATALVFSFVAAILAAASPVRDMDRRAAIWSHNRAQGETKNVVSMEDFVEWRRRQRSFDRFFAQRSGAVNLSGIAEPVRAPAMFVTADFFDVLGQQPVLGRAFRPEEEAPGAARVVILSYRFWHERFSRDPGVLGRELLLDSQAATIVGVLPDNDFSPDLTLPLTLDPVSPDFRARSLFVMGRLAAGVSLERARTEMAGIGTALEQERPDTHRGWGVNTRPLQEEFVGPQARLIFALLAAAAGAVLLIGCANIANLLLARGIGRGREIAVRTALGASRGRLIRQMLVESFVLAIAGTLGGLLVAHWGLGLLRREFVENGPAILRAVVDVRVTGFAAAAAVGSTLAFGLMPALQSVRGDVNLALRDGSRTTGGVRTRRLRAALVGAEVAAAVLFLVVALLFMRTLAAIQGIEPGFDARNILTLRVSLPEARYASTASIAAFHDRLRQALRGLDGVVEAGAAARVPAAGSRYNPNRSVTIEGRPPREGETLFASDVTVTPGYLETMRIGLRSGRPLEMRDGADAPLAVVVSETMVRRYWGGSLERALGARLRLGDEPSTSDWRTVVGIVSDVRNDDIDAPPLPMVYVPLAQRPAAEMTIVIRTSDEPTGHVADVRAAIARLDPEQPVYQIKSMLQIVEEDLRQSVVLLGILGIFAAVALALAALGIYGVVTHAVAQRTHEIGVRMALGAAVNDVLRLVIAQGLLPVCVGLAAGLGLGLAVSQLMRGILYGVTPADPATYAAVVLILMTAALAACVAPARRAAKVDPLIAIKG